MFLCFHVNFKHESTKACMFPCKFPFSAYPLHHNGKGLLIPNQPSHMVLASSLAILAGFEASSVYFVCTANY